MLVWNFRQYSQNSENKPTNKRSLTLNSELWEAMTLKSDFKIISSNQIHQIHFSRAPNSHPFFTHYSNPLPYTYVLNHLIIYLFCFYFFLQIINGISAMMHRTWGISDVLVNCAFHLTCMFWGCLFSVFTRVTTASVCEATAKRKTNNKPDRLQREDWDRIWHKYVSVWWNVLKVWTETTLKLATVDIYWYLL